MSDEITVEVDGFALSKLVERFSAEDLLQVVERGMKRGVNRIWERLPPYPPAKADSSYTRTGELGRNMATDAYIQGGEVFGKIGNKKLYAPYVIGGDDTQAKQHQGRWWQLPAQVEERIEDVVDAINDEIGKALNG